jgi:hypothetical protein
MTPMLVYMPIQQGSNSAAGSLPGIPDTAAGGLGQNTPKALIYRIFLMLEGRFWGLRRGFSLMAGKIQTTRSRRSVAISVSS